ncbi:hypothetical protein CXZ10_15710 [Pleomorphomonas diazotrophica]|uniref:Lipoprotein n=1 Tax=Pleomorphomonas diazotrophica TaxID=1166257 RepID=A0A1I4W0E9_9HYPH|nr:hypothetical protein [Pleomorphomonas diazotrophica]PKR88242.1 hypothetical protein CXZ10_15710 [Pleomorphomonas diazotrophica]SFN06875.1 hypothetical protein SAMN05192571_11455 [Pleomorphomonas diazotrophica]
MGFLSGTKRTGSLRLSGAVLAIALASVLAACQSTAPARPKAAAALAGPTVPAPPEATQPAVPAVPATIATFSFDQIKGVPTNKQDELARAIARHAQARNLRLVRRTEPTASYHVWGYLSAVGGDVGTNVTYVWDVLDQSGNRVLRFSGIEITGAAKDDPWESVDASALDTVAARTVEDVYAWINRLPRPSVTGAPTAQAGAAKANPLAGTL